MNTLTERLQAYMDYKGLNYNQVTVQAGLSIGQIGKAIKSNKGLHSDSIEKIINTYQDLNPEWLLSGCGDMIKNELSQKDKNDSGGLNEMNPLNEHQLNYSLKMQGEFADNMQESIPLLSPRCTQIDEMAESNSDTGHSSEEKGTDENVVYERIQKRRSEMKEYWQSEDYISENDRQSISEDYFTGGMSGKKDVRNLYRLTTRELSNKIAILKRDHKSSYNAYYKLFEAINNFKLGRYAERFEMPASWDEHIDRFEKDMGDEYSGVEDKKLKAVFYVLGYEDEVEDIRSSIEVAISKFKDASHYISRIQSMSEFGKKND